MTKKEIKQIAIIPARGGSKRLPRKNILPINNKPMLSYPVSTAIKSGLFDDIIVSTEDKEISEIATDTGATVLTRPENIAQDRSTVVQVCDHVLSLPEYRSVEIFCCLYATAILLQPCDLLNSRYLLDETPDADFVMGVSRYNYHPVQALTEKDGYLHPMWPEYLNLQSQYYPHLVVSNGTLYWARKKEFISKQSFYGNRLKGYVLPEERSVDIDTQQDYEKLLRIVSNNLLENS